MLGNVTNAATGNLFVGANPSFVRGAMGAFGPPFFAALAAVDAQLRGRRDRSQCRRRGVRIAGRVADGVRGYLVRLDGGERPRPGEDRVSAGPAADADQAAQLFRELPSGRFHALLLAISQPVPRDRIGNACDYRWVKLHADTAERAEADTYRAGSYASQQTVRLQFGM